MILCLWTKPLLCSIEYSNTGLGGGGGAFGLWRLGEWERAEGEEGEGNGNGSGNRREKTRGALGAPFPLSQLQPTKHKPQVRPSFFTFTFSPTFLFL